MSKTTPDRETASRLNPLISELFTEDTLDQCSRMVQTLGYLLSQIDTPPEGTEPHFGNLYLLFNPIAAALFYESENAYLAASARNKEAHHV